MQYHRFDGADAGEEPAFTLKQVAQHNTADDCWLIIRGVIYNVSAFGKVHPGGLATITHAAGGDATTSFDRIGHSPRADNLLLKMRVGVLQSEEGSEEEQAEGAGGTEEASVESGEPDESDSDGVEGVIVPKGRARDEEEGGPEEEDVNANENYAKDWHYARRVEIVKAHPEIKKLMRPYPLTILLGLFVAALHSATAILLIAYETPWWAVFLIAYSVGAGCKMYQFMIGHEFCHGLVVTNQNLSDFLMGVVTLPCLGWTIFMYCSVLHLGHHAHLAIHPDQVPFHGGQLHLDGDVVSVSTKMLISKLTREAKPIPIVPMQYHKSRIIRVIVNPLTHVAEFLVNLYMSILSIAVSLLYLAALPFAGLAMLGLLVFDRPRLNRYLTLAAKGPVRVGIKLLIYSLVWPSYLILLFYLGGQLGIYLNIYAEGAGGSAWPAVVYLGLSEMFQKGFLHHPYGGYFLAVHRSKGTFNSSNKAGAGPSPDRDCQPTMSMYSKSSGFLTGNLNLHVEHHDFPTVPWIRLPQVTKIAPEFYDNLVRSSGLIDTLYQYLHHGEGWHYACQ